MNVKVIKLLARISKEIEKNVKDIDWKYIYNEYNVDEYISFDAFGYEPTSIDSIVNTLYNNDKTSFKTFVYYIASRYNLNDLMNILNENEEILDENTIKFENNDDQIKMFISFSNENKNNALEIQKFFEHGGIDCFLSANKIEPSDEYKSEIFGRILESNIFIYVLSKQSKESDWCDQEMGMAYLKYKQKASKIFIISIDKTLPYGFLNGIQTEFIENPNYLSRIAEKIKKEFDYDVLDKIKIDNIESIDEKIKELKISDTFMKSSSLLSYLDKNKEYLTENQVHNILNISKTNDQIYNCFICKKPLKSILIKHKSIIDKKTYDEIWKIVN